MAINQQSEKFGRTTRRTAGSEFVVDQKKKISDQTIMMKSFPPKHDLEIGETFSLNGPQTRG
ncbi:hypothetical protein L484_000048 [Morus notabilis]|uniref:Uncharacterized protein n=1 Tax=Morus notabilis TaxID=981085 RepID=W9SPF0_9ROSA|nr:hypothetical protein L484_000048 [Morus notabilis]